MQEFKKKIHGYERFSNSVPQTTIIFSNDEVNSMVKIPKALEDAGFLMKGVSETLKNDTRKGGALPIIPMLLGTLGSSLTGNLLNGRGLFRAGNGNKYNCGQGMYRAGSKGKVLFRPGQRIKKKIINASTVLNKF